MNQNTTVTLIISTYNWVNALELVFLSLLKQSIKPIEVIIADDGSKAETRELIDHYRSLFSFPLVHVWHEDKGFRLAKIRNEAIKKAKGNYIVQIDGDIILHKDFIKDHLENARQGNFISGSRVLLGKEISAQLLKEKKEISKYLHKDTKNTHYAYRIPLLSKLFKSSSNDIQKVIGSVRGCNMSFWKNDLLQVNGYNENMIGWGREDSEISARLVNIGLSKINLKFSAIQHHIYHPSQSKEGLNTNDVILENTVKNKVKFTVNGIDKTKKEISQKKIALTAIIPTLNEESNIEDAIKTVSFADEIIVIDSLSTDKTVEIAEKMGVRVLLRKFDNFSSQKNFAIEQAKNDWIYVLDADERIKPTLRSEIINLLESKPLEVAFEMKMDYFFMGRLMKHGSFNTKTVIRLFNKNYCRYDGRPVHEQFNVKGETGTISQRLEHLSDKGIDGFIGIQNFYATLKAKELLHKKDTNIHLKALLKPPFRFFKHYVLQLGFLDGFQGLVFAGVQSYGVFMRYVKLWELKNK